ncbi:MAG: membrane protein insertion efficiency factor YidD [Planctomycetia bacterium TMED53]|nr:MAG: membrane protein insertion efficiency factor YidD [Planctomycetia bacterium TMED53]
MTQRKAGSLLARLFLGMIRFYRSVISPLLPPLCRFEPTCSCYAAEAIQTHGAFRGLRMTIWRLLRCHPFSRGGYDPVPAPKETKSNHP